MKNVIVVSSFLKKFENSCVSAGIQGLEHSTFALGTRIESANKSVAINLLSTFSSFLLRRDGRSPRDGEAYSSTDRIIAL